MKTFIRVMKALSDPNRVRILKILGSKELCVCEIQTLIGLAQSTTSKHMKLLEEAGLVDSRKEGSWIIYQLRSTPENCYAATMLEQLSGWLEEDSLLQQMKRQMDQVDRERICAA